MGVQFYSDIWEKEFRKPCPRFSVNCVHILVCIAPYSFNAAPWLHTVHSRHTAASVMHMLRQALFVRN